MGKRLRLLLIRDCFGFLALISFFFLPEPYGTILFIAFLIAIPRFQKTFAATPELNLKEKHVYVASNAAWVLVLLGLLARVVIRHPNSRALAICSVAALALVFMFVIALRQTYGSWPPSWLKTEQSKFIFIVGSVTVLALVCEWLFHLAQQRAAISADRLVNLVPPSLLLGLMYFVVLRQRRQFFPTLTWVRMLAIMFAFACVLIGVVVSL